MQNAGLFEQVDIAVPRSGRARTLFGHDVCGHHNLAWELNNDKRFRPEDGDIKSLLAEISTSHLTNCIISSEDFEYLHGKPQVLRDISRFFEKAGYRVQPIVVLRDQASYAESLYSELLEHGLSMSFQDFVARISTQGSFSFGTDWLFRFAYSTLLDAFASAFACTPIGLLYPQTADGTILLKAFADSVAPGLAFERCIMPTRLNERRHAFISSPRFSALDAERANSLTRVFQADNEELRLRYGVDLGDSGRSSVS